MRLQKFMAEAGIASRRKCEEYIKAGRVLVNGAPAELGRVIDPETDVVEFEGERVLPEDVKVSVAFYKPRGVMCTTSDPEGRETVSDYFLEFPYRLYNVGRLDYDSEGLIIMTNDGELAYKMMHPKFSVGKTYHAVCEGRLLHEEADALRRGVALDDGVTAPARVFALTYLKNGNTSLDITIHEGKNRQVRRMLAAVGHETLLLKRISIGGIELGDLKEGKWRYLTDAELASLEIEPQNR